MNINHSAEYLALWKSHKRAEWEAVRLDQESRLVAQVVVQGMSQKASTVGVMVRVSEETGPGDGINGEMRPEMRPEIDDEVHGEITVEQLAQESLRMWGLSEEIKAELTQVEAALTVDQRKNAEKVLKQWEREEQARR